MLNKPSTGVERIRCFGEDFSVFHDGTIHDSEGNELTVEEFTEITGIVVKDCNVLLLLAHQYFNWAPLYWKHLNVVTKVDGYFNPECLLVTIEDPVESLEYPGFYLIPYFSNYLITPKGKLLKRSNGAIIQASKGSLGYYTYRMTDDSGKTLNFGRHRILCLTFKPYDHRVENMDVNHKNGVPGDDWLDNLEWATRSENNTHAVNHGLKNDNLEVEVRDVHTGRVYIFASCNQAGRFFNVTGTTVANRAKSDGRKAYSGLQFRFHPNATTWPEPDTSKGNYRVVCSDGTEKHCDSIEAARIANLTRTSLMRMLREGRNKSQNGTKVFKDAD